MSVLSWLEGREKRAAREAFGRCYGVPYMHELDKREIRGMVLLERAGEVVRDDEGFSGIHWHLNPAKR